LWVKTNLNFSIVGGCDGKKLDLLISKLAAVNSFLILKVVKVYFEDFEPQS
jgi:hypothetical protein